MGRIEAAVDGVMSLAGQGPIALITDIDGTISRIAPRPEDAYVSERARLALALLSRSVGLVAVITGRDAETARRMVGLDGIDYIGNYALHRNTADFDEDALDAARAKAEEMLVAFPCVSFEEKGVSFALHYRDCVEPEAVRLGLISMMTPAAQAAGGRLIEGKRVIEIVPASLPDKGAAVAELAGTKGIERIVYVGDDISDVPAFAEVRRRREGGIEGLAIVVADRETEESVSAAADLRLEGVDEVEAWLDELAARLGKGDQP
jgi:trehalose 6-phosphate phosphatase